MPLNAAINFDEKSTEIIQLRQALKNEKFLREVSEVNNKELHEQIERHVAKIHQLELEYVEKSVMLCNIICNILFVYYNNIL